MDRTIDYRYAPSVIQTNVGLVDDPHKTIVREDGSLNYGYESRTLEFLELDDVERDRVSPAEQVDGYADPVDDRLGFAYRLTPQFAHEDELLDREQTYGDPGAAFVTTTETYEETTLSWTTFAYADADGLRADVIRWVLSASASFGRAPSRVELRLDGPDDDGLPTIVESPGTTAYWSADAVPAQQLRNYAFLESGDTREGVFAVVHEGEVFPPDHEYVRNLCSLLDAVDDRQGLPANTGWMHDQGVWTYGGTFYGLVWLYAGEPEKAVDYLYAFANHAAPNRAWREEQAFADTRSAEFLGDMPHSWAAAEFVRHVRSLLAFERGDDLELLPALPEEWLPAADEELALEGTPTRFGPVDLRLSRVDDGAGEATGDTAGEEYRLAYERTPGNREPAGLRVHVPGEVVHVSVPPAEEADGVLSFPGDCTAAELRFSR